MNRRSSLQEANLAVARSPPLLLVLDPIILLNHKTNMITVSPGSPDTAPYVSADDGSPIAEVVVPEGRTHQLDFTRVRFVMLPRDLTPLFPTKERLFRFWPALVYRNMGEVLNESLQLNPSKDIIVDHIKPNAPWIARLLFWGDVDVYSGSRPTVISIYSECIEVLDFFSFTEEFNRVIEHGDRSGFNEHALEHARLLVQSVDLTLRMITEDDIPSATLRRSLVGPPIRDVARRGKRDRRLSLPIGDTSGAMKELDPSTNDDMLSYSSPPKKSEGSSHSLSPHNDMVSDPVETVESLVSSRSQSSPETQAKTSRLSGKNRRKKTSARRRNKTKKSGSGSRLVWNEATHNAPKSRNERTCLVDSVCALLTGPECLKAKVQEAMLSAMPRSGDTSIASINDALEPFNMDLVPVTHLYNQPGGLPYHILQKQICKLVIRIKLSNLKNQTVYHSVGWDGSVIHDHPKMCIVNRTTDRRYWDDSKAVFDRLYPRKYFMGWQIATVYRLRVSY